MTILNLLLLLCAAGGSAVAVVGNTWNPRAVGLKRLTLTGRVAVVLVLVGAGFGVTREAISHHQAEFAAQETAAANAARQQIAQRLQAAHIEIQATQTALASAETQRDTMSTQLDSSLKQLKQANATGERVENNLTETQAALASVQNQLAASETVSTDLKAGLIKAKTSREALERLLRAAELERDRQIQLANQTHETLVIVQANLRQETKERRQADARLVAAREAAEAAARERERQFHAFHEAARQNIRWAVQQDAGARGRYNLARGAGRSRFEAVLFAQSHNGSAQETIRQYGTAHVEKYIRDLGA